VEAILAELTPYQNNTKCEYCKKMFYSNQDNPRGSKRKFCSLRCRNAAYFKRRAQDYKSLKDENQSLYLKIARLENEIKKLKEGSNE
jgi:endogenous inhibitor of DNA gyrase (YacG/DUF329 family)